LRKKKAIRPVPGLYFKALIHDTVQKIVAGFVGFSKARRGFHTHKSKAQERHVLAEILSLGIDYTRDQDRIGFPLSTAHISHLQGLVDAAIHKRRREEGGIFYF
jgi:hypothetical protein